MQCLGLELLHLQGELGVVLERAHQGADGLLRAGLPNVGMGLSFFCDKGRQCSPERGSLFPALVGSLCNSVAFAVRQKVARKVGFGEHRRRHLLAQVGESGPLPWLPGLLRARHVARGWSANIERHLDPGLAAGAGRRGLDDLGGFSAGDELAFEPVQVSLGLAPNTLAGQVEVEGEFVAGQEGQGSTRAQLLPGWPQAVQHGSTWFGQARFLACLRGRS